MMEFLSDPDILAVTITMAFVVTVFVLGLGLGHFIGWLDGEEK